MKEMFQSESRGNLAVDEILATIYIKRVLCLICVYIYIGRLYMPQKQPQGD